MMEGKVYNTVRTGGPMLISEKGGVRLCTEMHTLVYKSGTVQLYMFQGVHLTPTVSSVDPNKR